MFICIAIAYESWLMLLPILTLLIYAEIFVRWHQSVDIAMRFGTAWLDYKKSVRNWIPRLTPYVA
jgi:protein-S-isoprenylcysteine O-methyltransferase Ste14